METEFIGGDGHGAAALLELQLHELVGQGQSDGVCFTYKASQLLKDSCVAFLVQSVHELLHFSDVGFNQKHMATDGFAKLILQGRHLHFPPAGLRKVEGVVIPLAFVVSGQESTDGLRFFRQGEPVVRFRCGDRRWRHSGRFIEIRSGFEKVLGQGGERFSDRGLDGCSVAAGAKEAGKERHHECVFVSLDSAGEFERGDLVGGVAGFVAGFAKRDEQTGDVFPRGDPVSVGAHVVLLVMNLKVRCRPAAAALVVVTAQDTLAQ